jgi:hypothetical protein
MLQASPAANGRRPIRHFKFRQKIRVPQHIHSQGCVEGQQMSCGTFNQASAELQTGQKNFHRFLILFAKKQNTPRLKSLKTPISNQNLVDTNART